MKLLNFCLVALTSTLIVSCTQQVKQPLEVNPLFSNGMVLQQKSNAVIWGTFTPNKPVTVNADWGEEITTTADTSGYWNLKLPTPEAGGPHSIYIMTKDSNITIDNVLIGEVWLASGQSNMEMPLQGWPPADTILNSKQEITIANYPNIRMLTVKRSFSSKPETELKGGWQEISPETTPELSATAYFFAKKLHKELNVPIGIVHTSWGGTVAEAWTSAEALTPLHDFNEAIQRIQNPETQAIVNNWYNSFESVHIPEANDEWNNLNLNDTEISKTDFNDTNWQTIEIPGRIDIVNNTELDGVLWFRNEFEINNPEKAYTLSIGAVDDMDVTYINGQKVGSTLGAGFWAAHREYEIPKGLLKKGSNLIAIKAIDTGGPGLIVSPVKLTSENEEIDLAGEWKYLLTAESYGGKYYNYGTDCDINTRPDISAIHQNIPTALFNAMINPLIPFTIKGAIWYQGESNVGRAEQYEKLFPTMINDWRSRWGYQFPFYYVQIAPFKYGDPSQEQQSPNLRNAQRKALATPNTGMVVTLDIGNPNNIHPANKQDVGKRLASLALKNNYGKDIMASGPLFKKASLKRDRIIIEFENAENGLKFDNKLTGFEIAGENQVYLKAFATIVGNTVELSSKLVSNPKYARYAWSDEAEATLFNNEGLPASTFTTE